MSEEFFESIKDNIKEKLNSPVYGTFFISWLIFHWQTLVVLFFVNESYIWETNNILKSEFILKYFFDVSGGYFWFTWIMPLLVTILVIWVFPKYITIPAYKKTQEDNVEKKIIKSNLETRLKKAEKETIFQTLKNIDLVKEKTKKEKELDRLDPELQWQKEYEEFKNLSYFNMFKYLLDVVYSKGGVIIERDAIGAPKYNIPSGLLAYADTSGLIKINNDKNLLELTDKGKYFVKKYTLVQKTTSFE